MIEEKLTNFSALADGDGSTLDQSTVPCGWGGDCAALELPNREGLLVNCSVVRVVELRIEASLGASELQGGLVLADGGATGSSDGGLVSFLLGGGGGGGDG